MPIESQIKAVLYRRRAYKAAAKPDNVLMELDPEEEGRRFDHGHEVA